MPDPETRAEVSEQRYYIEVERTQYADIEIVACSMDEANEIVAEMTPRELSENAGDWDWDGFAPNITGVTRVESEL